MWEIYKGVNGLQIDPRTGGSIQRSGIGDTSVVPLRAVALGAVANAEVLAGGGNGDGIVNIKEAMLIALYINFTKGSLTSADVIPEFSNTDDVAETITPLGWYRLATAAISAGVMTIKNGIYRYVDTLKNIIVIPNPGANFMRVFTSSIGTTTSSSMRIDAARGWGHPQILGV